MNLARSKGLQLAALLALSLAGDGRQVAPRKATWDELQRETFDLRWIIPPASAAELSSSKPGTVDLVAELERLLEMRFAPGPGDSPRARAASLGDLLANFGPLREDTRAADAELELLRSQRPDVWKSVGHALGELVRERRFRSKRWDPDEDRADDGFLVAAPRDLALVAGGPWKSSEGSTLAVQVATLMRADLEAIKSAENDFRTWPGRVGASYESIGVVPDSFVRGSDPDGRPFAALALEFRSDLPFPFGSFTCDLRMLHRLDAAGRLESDVESTSEDFFWLAGRDTFLPVLDAQGSFVGMLCIRVSGADLRGVPDKLSHHESGAREGIGNLKREAERLWAAHGEREPVVKDSVPEFKVFTP
jgi:hypothetical protein